MNKLPHPGFDKPEEYETFTTANQPEDATPLDIDRLVDIIYEQGIAKGRDDAMAELKDFRP